MSIPEALPWHGEPWRLLASAMQAGRVHHALLLQGAGGLGKLRFAERAAAALLCEATTPASARPCGECRSCRLVEAGSHPDRLTLEPEEDRRVIDVGQVRERIAELALTPHYASRRVIVVHPADALNRHAANTLLKTLEEPPGGAMFLLVCARPSLLPATVRSRCSALRFGAPDADTGTAWLGAQESLSRDDAAALLGWCAGAPLAALDAHREGSLARYEELVAQIASLVTGQLEPVQAAAGWRALGLATLTRWQLRVVHEAMRIKALGDPAPAGAAMQGICGRLDLARLDGVCEELLELRSAVDRQLNPGDQLALEGLASTWRDAGAG